VPEPLGGAHQDPDQAAALVDQALQQALADIRGLSIEARLERRYEKFRHIGALGEGIAQTTPRSPAPVAPR
jgi:acetyl-CoA carboxylase carboxyl transferase subunit alpha